MAYRASEVLVRAEVLRDLRSDDTGEMLAYCARVLDVLERRAVAEQHGVALEPKLSLIQAALDRHSGGLAAAAQDLGLSIRMMRYYVKRYGLIAQSRG